MKRATIIQLLLLLAAACNHPAALPATPKPPEAQRENVAPVLTTSQAEAQKTDLAAAQEPPRNDPAPAAPPAAAPAAEKDTSADVLRSTREERKEALAELVSGAAMAPAMKRAAANGMGALGKAGHGGGQASGAARLAYAPIASQPAQDSLRANSAETNTERYAHKSDNPFDAVKDAPLSTFSIDVDTASYSNVRRFLRDGVRPPADAVRIEELVNYFSYDYPAPEGAQPFSISTEVSTAPWNTEHRLVRIGLRGRSIETAAAPASNLVFLIDVSGSMEDPDKLPLLKRGLTLLAKRLRAQDHIAMVVYAGASGLVLPATAGNEQDKILSALEHLEAGGSTNGADGIRLAYQVAHSQFVKGGVNRVILATDGDFNVGTTSEGELVRLIEQERKSGVFLTVLGFGRGNLNDSGMEALADHGNGNYAYIDSIAEAHKVLVRTAGSTLVTIAKDVKLQIEWNPSRVASYRLIGFENRMLAARDFNDDTKDAGEIGAGHTMTALYEVVPTNAAHTASGEVDALRYQAERSPSAAAQSDELMTIKIRYKRPDADQSQLLSQAVRDDSKAIAQTSEDFRWAAAVASFGMLLRDSKHKAGASIERTKQLARSALGADPHGERHELLGMIEEAAHLGVGVQL